MRVEEVVRETKNYYDGPADEVYRHIWQDNIHMGTWINGKESLHQAMDQTNRIMAEQAGIQKGHDVLDAGCGYGATARFLVETYGCHVIGTNISEKELEVAEQRADAADLNGQCRFEYGDFHKMRFPDGSFDIVWSQEAFLHGADKTAILQECYRVLKDGGRLVLSDLLVHKETPQDIREKIYERIQSPDMWDFADYRSALEQVGFSIVAEEDWHANVARTYHWVASTLRKHRRDFEERLGTERVGRTLGQLDFWVDAAMQGQISQGFFVAQK